MYYQTQHKTKKEMGSDAQEKALKAPGNCDTAFNFLIKS